MNPTYKDLRILITDVDGVMTNGKKTYDVNGNVISKEFNDQDFSAIIRFKKQRVRVILISGDERVNKEMARERNLEFYYSRDKLKKAQELNLDLQKCAYIGDDYPDIELLSKVKYPFCPRNAVQKVWDTCFVTGQVEPEDYEKETASSKNGGEGVLMDFYELIFENKSTHWDKAKRMYQS